jgi:hypothetical protein
MLEARGLLDETLVIWAGEFGTDDVLSGKSQRNNTAAIIIPSVSRSGRQGAASRAARSTARRMISPATSPKTPVDAHDFQATILHLLGIDHTRLTFKYQGRHYRLTDVHGKVVKGVLA